VKLLNDRWHEERKRDMFYKLAKKEGYRSRAAYKLLQANRSFHFIKTGDCIVDLGCAPGGWLQATREIVGPTGHILGVDIKPVEPLSENNVKIILSDITDQTAPIEILNQIKRKADAVLSDASPNISGAWDVDHAKQIDLARSALKIAFLTLREGGSFFVKVFDGPLLKEYVREVKLYFKDVRLVKPKASKAKSAELYILAMKFRG
jgi:23S rRNA (uridine2552-2'-O)-methyltransferase